MIQVKDFIKAGIDEMITTIWANINSINVKVVCETKYVKDLTVLFPELAVPEVTADSKAKIALAIRKHFEAQGFTVSYTNGTVLNLTFILP